MLPLLVHTDTMAHQRPRAPEDPSARLEAQVLQVGSGSWCACLFGCTQLDQVPPTVQPHAAAQLALLDTFHFITA